MLGNFSKTAYVFSVIANTSMNVMGEPIVNTPEHAHNMLLKTDMDYLVMGNFLISRNGF